MCSSSEEETEDELTSRAPQGRENRPPWANTPEVSKSLLQQRSIRPEDIFGEVEPVKLEGTLFWVPFLFLLPYFCFGLYFFTLLLFPPVFLSAPLLSEVERKTVKEK